MDKTLSDSDILKAIKNRANLMTYRELKKYKTLDEALGPHGALVLLYETKDNFGHWVGVFKRTPTLVEFFDSYGYKPDDEIKFIPDYFRKVNDLDYPHLTALLYKSGYKISYNEHKLQKLKNDVNTCGRWVVARLIMRDLPLNEFVKMFKERGVSSDTIVTLLTKNV